LGLLKKSRITHARPNVPALVQVAALAIIMIRCLDVLMILLVIAFFALSWGFVRLCEKL